MENITVTFNNLSAAQAANLFAALQHDYDGPAPAVAPVVQPSAPEPEVAASPEVKPRRGRKSKPVEPEAPTGDATPPSQALPLTEAPAAIEDVRNALSDLLAAKGMTECAQLLAQFGATRIGELPPEKYSAVVAACKGAQA